MHFLELALLVLLQLDGLRWLEMKNHNYITPASVHPFSSVTAPLVHGCATQYAEGVAQSNICSHSSAAPATVVLLPYYQ
jgi:hypothetical protein